MIKWGGGVEILQKAIQAIKAGLTIGDVRQLFRTMCEYQHHDEDTANMCHSTQPHTAWDWCHR